jgi:hypothetical protein
VEHRPARAQQDPVRARALRAQALPEQALRAQALPEQALRARALPEQRQVQEPALAPPVLARQGASRPALAAQASEKRGWR